MILDEKALFEKLRRIEALHVGATTPGERDAAANAIRRIQERLKLAEKEDPPVRCGAHPCRSRRRATRPDEDVPFVPPGAGTTTRRWYRPERADSSQVVHTSPRDHIDILGSQRGPSLFYCRQDLSTAIIGDRAQIRSDRPSGRREMVHGVGCVEKRQIAKLRRPLGIPSLVGDGYRGH
jgi:hypothetical protein